MSQIITDMLNIGVVLVLRKSARRSLLTFMEAATVHSVFGDFQLRIAVRTTRKRIESQDKRLHLLRLAVGWRREINNQRHNKTSLHRLQQRTQPLSLEMQIPTRPIDVERCAVIDNQLQDDLKETIHPELRQPIQQAAGRPKTTKSSARFNPFSGSRSIEFRSPNHVLLEH
ncbi:uncharacterized protein EAE97_011331 [Botrytis byssoidea]|uniref:Uncharacterized protein n=1 Tax=Botrytis byssoidea TaxID=139641 RepID=A0A9P5LTD1_9HELO|nr:uncharacterized protein EAE97_011331 [Botrytis byssoidea]KAF7921063.1 hypothetical protein EAE97_011331 [Botrytis byssoidea]